MTDEELKAHLFEALQQFYPGTDADWDFDPKYQRLVAKEGTHRKLNDGRYQTIRFYPDTDGGGGGRVVREYTNESDGWESIDFLRHNLSWRWTRSFDRLELQPDGTAAAYFKLTYKDGYYKSRAKTVFYELKIVFHPHPYEAGVNWHFGKMSFGGARLPKDYKEEIVEQYRRILKNHAWVEEKRNAKTTE